MADSLATRSIKGVEIVAPAPLTRSDLLHAHSGEYVNAVRTGSPSWLAESQGFQWDAAMWPMVLASNGGVLAAARSALTDGAAGSLSSGLHHARYDEGAGYCTFNGLVITAKTLLAAGEVFSVLILDLDAHCGGGTAQLVDGDSRIWHTDVAVSDFDTYPVFNRSNYVDDAQHYLPVIQQALKEAETAGPFDICLYNAGMDPHEGCVTGGIRGITSEVLARREQLVFHWCRQRNLPVAFVLAGGYVSSKLSQETLVDLHRLTITEAAGAGGGGWLSH
nr:hypothetical protein [Mycobacterium sp. OTB74]